MPDNLRLAQRIALVLGAFELPAALLWAVLGAGIYGSPLSGVQREGLLIIAALFVLAGPLWMLPLAIVARSWPRAAGRLLLAGAMCASVLAVHPWGLAYADYSLYTNVWVAVLGVSLVTAGVGVALLTTGRRSKAWLEVLGIAGAAIVGMIAVTSAIERRDVAVRWHTTYPINFFAFAPDGRSLIAAGKYSGSNAHWERYGKASLSVVNAATGEVRVLAERTSKHLMTPDRGTLITINDETHLWDTRTWTQRATVESTSNVAFPARGLLVIKQRARLLLIDVTTGNTRWSIEYERDNQPAWLAVSGDATTLAAGGWPRGGAARIWDVATQRSRVIPVIETEPITEAQFSPDGALLAMRAEAKGITRLRLWSLRQNRALPSLDEQAFSHFLWFSPDGRSMVTWRADSTQPGPPRESWSLWDTATWRKKASARGGHALAWSPDGRTFATMGVRSDLGLHSVVLYSVSDGHALATFGVDFFPTTLAFSPDSAVLAIGGQGESVHGWYTPGRIAVFSSANVPRSSR